MRGADRRRLNEGQLEVVVRLELVAVSTLRAACMLITEE